MKYKIFGLAVALVFLAAACNKPVEQTQTPPPTPPVVATPNPTPPPTTPVIPPPSPKPTPTPVPTPVPTPQPTPTPPVTSPPPAASERNFTVTADDDTATPSMLMVNRGDKVNLTITLKTQNVYQYGLEFRGGDVNTGTILPGGSKTISFNVVNGFTLNSYWPSSGVQKSASIMIHINE